METQNLEKSDTRDGRELLEKIKRAQAFTQAIEDLAEKDSISDAIWELRGKILDELKAEGYLASDSTGPDNISTINHMARVLLEQI